MNIQINTELKEIRIIGETSALELIAFLEQYRGMGYKVVPNYSPVTYPHPLSINTPHTGSPTPYKTTTNPYAPPYTVTC